MITAAVTAAVGAVLAYFGVPPGPYLVGVAIAVKVLFVGLALLFGVKALAQKKAEAAQAAPVPVDPEALKDGPGRAR